ncbi:MAG TPA: tetratricopeptide repeat protein [Ilumatobacteraceae bacterium]
MGARLVLLPAVVAQDPLSTLVEPSVAEHHRFCRRCTSPVGRGTDGSRAATSGRCNACGEPFQFEAPLRSGQVLANQYEIAGCLAHGGNGWVYLARDRAIDWWVVIKGVLSGHNPHARSAALAERRILADVDHSNIVKILNLVSDGDEDYIVMEYVRGVSLRAMLDGRSTADGRPCPLPVDEVIEYLLEILPAIHHLHQIGFAYCDFKPDNLMRTGGSMKLIDLGSAVRLDEDRGSDLSATRGYYAPELEHTRRPNVASDIFTVGRTLAVLCTNFTGFQSSFRYTLPSAESVPLYTRYESLYGWLERATALQPGARFESVTEAASQLNGVLREIVAEREELRPSPSTAFTGERTGSVRVADPRRLPAPLIDPDNDLEQWRVQSLLDSGQFDDAANAIEALDERDSTWRAQWYRGVLAMLTGDHSGARSRFIEVDRALPGELAPKLALAMSDDISGNQAEASRMYRRVARTDSTFRSAVFGLARCCVSSGDRRGAIEALLLIPHTSSNFVTATIMHVELLLHSNGALDPVDVDTAAGLIELLPRELPQRRWLEVYALEAMLDLLLDGRPEDEARYALGVPHTQRSVRRALERAYRSLARQGETSTRRIALVERANAVRPRSVL